MRAFRCPVCQQFAFFETQTCSGCGAVIGFHIPTRTLIPAPAEGIVIESARWLRCSSWSWGCNWLVAENSGSAQCFAGRLIRRRPEADDTIALEKLARAGNALRRLLFQLVELGIPIVPYYEKSGGLAFDLLSSYSSNDTVTIGHANGVVTIDLAETLDAHREAVRVRLGEAYRTMLGHFRHEVGHYYQSILVENGPAIDECRALFGDERASYRESIDRHYKFGAPADWQDAYISEYATMHPWEDFAETFAHYLHITDTLATAAASGVVLHGDRIDGYTQENVALRHSYTESDIATILSDWHWLSLMLNRVTRAMGKADLYPFTIPDPVTVKLGFVHNVIRSAAAQSVGSI